MPSRFFVPVPGLDPHRARVEFVHAAFSRWFDQSHAEHTANDKPYAISPASRDDTGHVGVEVATLTVASAARFAEAAQAGASVRIGNQIRTIGTPRLMWQASWADLATRTADCRWDLDFVTPVTFRSGDRSSPLPHPRTILTGLERAWQAWSDTPLPALGEGAGAVWASDLELSSRVLPMVIGRPDGSRRELTVSGSLGRLTLRCDDPSVASVAGPLLHLASYTGVGSMTLKGLGVTRVRSHARRSGPSADHDSVS